MAPGMDADVIVVGGGISGLACAWALQSRGVDVLLLEAAGRSGGCIGTLRDRGCLLEEGPNSALDTSPALRGLLDELGIAGERVNGNPSARNRFVVRDGRVLALPMSPSAFLSTPLFSPAAKLRLLGEWFVPKRRDGDDESVAAFVRRRIGSEFLDYAINPFVGGVYAGRPEQLSLQSAFPRLHELERRYGSLLRGQILGARERARKADKSKHAAQIFSFRDGMDTLTGAIARRLARVELNVTVDSISAVASGYSVTATGVGTRRAWQSRAIVLAVPAYAAAPLIEPSLPRAAAALKEIPYPPVAVVHSLYRRGDVAHALDGFGMLVPECEHRGILGAIFSSTLFPGRSDAAQVLLTSFVGGTRQPELAMAGEPKLLAQVQREHQTLLGATAPPVFARVRRWPRAIPQYTVGHAGRISLLEEAEKQCAGVYFCANYRGGVSIPDCVSAAQGAAETVRQFLQTTTGSV